MNHNLLSFLQSTKDYCVQKSLGIKNKAYQFSGILAITLITSSCSYFSSLRNHDPFIQPENLQNTGKTFFRYYDQSEGKEEYSFAVFGDFGSGNENQYKVAKLLEERCKTQKCDFVLLLGDNFYKDGIKRITDQQFITKFEIPYQSINVPFYAVLGNHDYRGQIYPQIRYSKRNSKWFLPARTYSFGKDFIDFFAIDSNIPSQAQEDALKQKIDASKAKWKFVFGHHPRFSSGLHGDAGESLAKMLDNTLCDKVDFYLSGHDHHKEHVRNFCGVEHVISGAGGADLRPIFKNKDSNFSISSFGFAWFRVTPKEVYFEFVNLDGKVEYSYTRDKAHVS